MLYILLVLYLVDVGTILVQKNKEECNLFNASSGYFIFLLNLRYYFIWCVWDNGFIFKYFMNEIIKKISFSINHLKLTNKYV